jgi:hypothetical protein
MNVEESLMIRGRDGGIASGGSSPSREVQQILSQDKDGECKGYESTVHLIYFTVSCKH